MHNLKMGLGGSGLNKSPGHLVSHSTSGSPLQSQHNWEVIKSHKVLSLPHLSIFSIHNDICQLKIL